MGDPDELDLAARRLDRVLADLNTLRSARGMTEIEAFDTNGWLARAGSERYRQWEWTESTLRDITARLERLESLIQKVVHHDGGLPVSDG